MQWCRCCLSVTEQRPARVRSRALLEQWRHGGNWAQLERWTESKIWAHPREAPFVTAPFFKPVGGRWTSPQRLRCSSAVLEDRCRIHASKPPPVPAGTRSSGVWHSCDGPAELLAARFPDRFSLAEVGLLVCSPANSTGPQCRRISR